MLLSAASADNSGFRGNEAQGQALGSTHLHNLWPSSAHQDSATLIFCVSGFLQTRRGLLRGLRNVLALNPCFPDADNLGRQIFAFITIGSATVFLLAIIALPFTVFLTGRIITLLPTFKTQYNSFALSLKARQPKPGIISRLGRQRATRRAILRRTTSSAPSIRPQAS